MKFISPDRMHRYIRKLGLEAMDIEFQLNFNLIERSGKAYIIWNPYGYLAFPKKNYIAKYQYYEKLLAENKPVYIVERGALPNSIFIDKNGFLVDSTSYDEKKWNSPLNSGQLKEVDNYIDELKNDSSSLEPQQSKRLDEVNFFKQLKAVEKYKRTVFVPLQLHSDTVIKLWSDWIGDQAKFIDLVHQLAATNPDICFIVKNHPTEENPNMKILQETSNIFIADDFHYKDCIQYSDLTLTINSGLGLQTMIWGKPALIVGKSFYQFDNINYKVNDINDIQYLLCNAIEPDMEKVKRFIHYLRFEFYSFCFMRKTSKNASEPTLFEKITYEDTSGKRIIVNQTPQDEKIINILFDFIKQLKDYSVMKTTCLDCIRYCSLESDHENLFIATTLDDKIRKELSEKGYSYNQGQKSFKKDGITIHIEDMPRQTKIMTLYGEEVNVPVPVVGYLQKLYTRHWMTCEINKKKPIVQPKNGKPNIAYTFNLHGWAFEFESLYYKKHSKLNIIPMLQRDLKNTRNNLNAVMIPSAWHYRDLTKKGIIMFLKRQNIKIIAQYNSHITGEIEHEVKGADLIMVSSMKLYDDVYNRYGFENMVYMPHFVDTDIFQAKNQYNNFTLGWVGNFKNTYKQPHLVEGIEYPIKFKTDYKDSLKYKGKQEGMAEYYNDIDVLLITSKSEGTPMPLLEAMSCGKTVLSTDVGRASEVLSPNFIVNGDTDKEIIENFNLKLKWLSQNKNLIIYEGKRNRKFIRQYVDWKTEAHVLDDIYKSLLENDLHKIRKIVADYHPCVRA